MMLISLFCFLIVASEDRLHADAVSRLEPDKLLAVRESIDSLKSQWQAVPRDSAYREHRANLHVHSHWSHDSRGTIDDIVAAAKRVGTSVLMFNEHPADHYDFFKDGHQGIKDGVLLIPGSEMKGFLAFPTISLKGVSFDKPQELADVVRGRGGQIFVSHLEERMDWQIQGITGVEIYNTHADFKDEKAMNIKLRNPLGFLQIAESIRKYP
ncbi:MAG: hypothetical protein FJ267_10430, partial [Planctomycetes bacterium]|nr:hypothetical protein [Planctomycetota bacterium]